MDDSSMKQLQDRLAISDVVHRYAAGVDRRDWSAYRDCFTDEVLMDLSSWNGAPAASLSADAWVDGVRKGLSGFDATQHVSSNHLVEIRGDEAECTSYVQASHCFEGERIVLGGYYEMGFARTDSGWRIHSSKLVVTWKEGPNSLFERAAKRFAESEEAGS
jgi:ketosteroid isomerase-like protein